MIRAAADTASPWVSTSWIRCVSQLQKCRRWPRKKGHFSKIGVHLPQEIQFTQKIRCFTIERIGNHQVLFGILTNIDGLLPCNKLRNSSLNRGFSIAMFDHRRVYNPFSETRKPDQNGVTDVAEVETKRWTARQFRALGQTVWIVRFKWHYVLIHQHKLLLSKMVEIPGKFAVRPQLIPFLLWR